MLTTQAAPLALKILDLIDGPKQADGTRSGGLKTRQQGLLATESQAVLSEMSFLQNAQWVLLFAGLSLAGLLAYVTARSIVPPILRMTGAMGELANGDTSITVPETGRTDEIGEMASAVQVFKDNMIEADRLRANGRTWTPHRGPAQSRHAKARRYIPGGGRQYCGDRFLRVDRTGSGGRESDAYGRNDPAIVEHGGGRLGRGVVQRSDGGRRHRGVGLLGHRDRPSGSGIEQYRATRGDPG